MKKALTFSAALTILLVLSTMICGLWIAENNITDAGSASFHMTCGIISAVFSLITMALLMVFFRRIKKEG